ncbi:MAG: hypothetical protein QME47_00155 [Candidatus Thermoplasmatota archaeon]|nr:hypothetical protein [Candidatus Thermoplasmatota archaeon]
MRREKLNIAMAIAALCIFIIMCLNFVGALAEQANKSSRAMVMFRDDVEDGNSAWTNTTKWQIWTTENHSAAHSWNCGNGGYGPKWDEKLTSVSMNIVPGMTTLTIWHKYDFEKNWDGGLVEIYSDGSWKQLTPARGYDATLNTGCQNPIEGRDAFTGNSNGWRKDTFDIVPYVAKTVQIRFWFGSDNFDTSHEGWNIDDITITDVATDDTPPQTAPVFTGQQGNNNWYNSPVKVDFQTSESVWYTRYKIEDGEWQKGSNVTLSDDSESLTVYYYSVDLVGNNETVKTFTLKIDATPPLTNYTLSGNNGTDNWFRSSVQITLSPSDATSGVNYTKYKINDGYWQTGTGFTLTDEGQYTIYYYTVDQAGNAEAQKNFTIGIDKTVPEVYSITINSGATYTNSTSIQLSLSAYDLLSGLWQMQFSNDGSSWSEWRDWNESVSWSLASGSDGERKVFFRVRDKAGNQAPSIYDTIILDQTPPATCHSISGMSGSNNWYVSNVTVSLSPQDATSGIKKTYYKLGSGSWQEGTSISLSQEGTHTVYYYSIDNAGNSELEKSVIIKIDKNPPETSHPASGTLGNNGWYTSNVSVTLTSWDSTSGVNYTKYREHSICNCKNR